MPATDPDQIDSDKLTSDKVVELDCPECLASLTIDRGFAGGICRCAECAALLAVPRKAAGGRVEVARPESPTARPAAPAPAVNDGATLGLDLDTSHKPEPTAFVTDSGRRIEVEDPNQIPVATLQAVRRITTGVVVLITAVVSAVLIAAIVWIVHTATAPKEDRSIEEAQAKLVQVFPYDSEVNPYTLEEPNVLGLAIRDRTVVVIDASEPSAETLPRVKAAVRIGLTRGGSDARVLLLYSGHTPMREGFTALDALRASDLDAYHDGVAASGEPRAAQSIAWALEREAQAVIWVTGARPSRGLAERLESMLAEHPEVRLDVLLVGRTGLSSLRRLVEQRGTYQELPVGLKLDPWLAEAGLSVD